VETKEYKLDKLDFNDVTILRDAVATATVEQRKHVAGQTNPSERAKKILAQQESLLRRLKDMAFRG
jgi:hypothetical protein